MAKRKLNPLHLQIIRLFWVSYTYQEIATLLGCTVQTVHNVITSAYGVEILSLLESRSIDTTPDIQALFQAAAPEVAMEKIRLATSARDERVRNVACKDVLEMAGHSPLRRVQIEKADAIQDKYDDMGPEELKKEFARLANVAPAPAPESDIDKDNEPTLH